MSLQWKFAALIAMLTLTVGASLGVAAWSFTLLQREVAQPIRELAPILQGLRQARDGLADLTTPPADRSRRRDAVDRVLDGLAIAEAADAENRWTRRSSWRNLRTRAGQIGVISREADVSASLALLADHSERAMRVAERIEFGLFEEQARLAGELGADLRARLLTVLGLALLTSALVGVLTLLLTRRWVIRRVSALRVATDRIASGDFTHRIPASGDDEIARLSREVNHMAEMVREMQEQRVQRERLAAIGEMVRRLAHNLRNPLSGIRSLAEISRDDLPEHEDVREHQTRIIRTVDRFEQWLSDLLSATSPLQIRPSAQPVRRWLENVVETHRPAAEARSVRLAPDLQFLPEIAEFDPRHLEQAIVALLTNAIEVSPEGGEVRVVAACVREGAGGWEIRVEDQGPGVAPELASRVFSAHFSTKPGGNGIGLAVAQEVARGHGGSIHVERGLPQPGQEARGKRVAACGAAFVLRLPDRPGGSAGEVSGVTGVH